MRLRKLCFCIADPRDGEDGHGELRDRPRRPKARRRGKSRGLATKAPNEPGAHGHGSSTNDGGTNDGGGAALMVGVAYASSTLVGSEGGSSHGHGDDGGGCDGCDGGE